MWTAPDSGKELPRKKSDMKPGRNELCPCGSGKKYKKCCLGKPVQSPATKGVAERRFRFPVPSFYTQAALEEALKPGGTVQIHPYVLLKLREDPRIAEAARPKDRARLLESWKPSQLVGMSTDEIESRLSLTGVFDDRAQFAEQTKSRRSASDIADEWGRHLIGLKAAELDFLRLAACELWRRFCPDRPSVEMIDDWLCEGYAFAAEAKPAEALAAWWKVWESLRSRLTAEMTNLEEAGERLFFGMSQCLSNWSQDFRLEAINASVKNPECGELGIRFIRELLAALPEEEERLQVTGDLAMLYFNLQRDAEGEDCCQKLIRDHPERATGYVHLSDGLLRDSFRGAPDSARIRRAIDLLERALAKPVTDAEDFDVASRLAEARDLLSKSARS